MYICRLFLNIFFIPGLIYIGLVPLVIGLILCLIALIRFSDNFTGKAYIAIGLVPMAASFIIPILI